MLILNRVLLLCSGVGIVLASSAAAEPIAGKIDAISGAAEVRRGENGEWVPGAEGSDVFPGDQFRTGRGSRIRIKLEGGSGIELTGGSELSVDRFERNARSGRNSAIVRLDQGAVRVSVASEFAQGKSKFELETPTAIATVHGTEFVVVFDPSKGVTNVLGISDTVDVQSTIGVVGPRVSVGPSQLTRIETGKFPTPPRGVDESTMERYRQAFEIVVESPPALVGAHPGLKAQVLRPEDVPDTFDPTSESEHTDRLRIGAPKDSIARRVSPDFDATEQPIPEFDASPPGIPPMGGIVVDF